MTASRPFISEPELVVVRPESETMTRQRLPNFVGVSGASAGAKGISMNLVIIPAGGAAEPHQPVNLSSSEPAYAIVARNDPNEQESVVPYHP